MRPLLATLVVLVAMLAGGTAGAHGGPGVVELVVTPLPGGVEVVATVTYEVDGHAAESARVDAAVTASDGTVVAQVDLLPSGPPGRYAGSVAVPAGVHTVEVTSAFPPGAASAPVEVPVVGPDAEAGAASEALPDAGGEVAPAVDPGVEVSLVAPDAAPVVASAGGSGGAPVAVRVGLATAAVVAVALGAWAVARRWHTSGVRR